MTIVVLGDSLASGHGIDRAAAFPAVLQTKLDGARLPYRIANQGISGDTTAGGVRRVARALDNDARVLVLALGINDGLRGIPVAQVKANLAAIIRTARARDIRILLCRMEALPVYGWDYTFAFRRMFDELAAEYQIALVPFFLESLVGNLALMQADRMHPNAAGARVIADRVWPYLRAQLSAST
ncbi:MAG: arylesterase [Acidobacteriota bacterium]